MVPGTPRLSLEEARQLVKYLEEGDQAAADALLQSATTAPDNSELFAEIGKLTRQLHESLKSFSLDGRISDLATEDIPDAKERLNYVISMTEQAANKTMDAVETCIPIAESMQQNLAAIMPVWERLMSRDIKVGEFKELCRNLDTYLKEANKNSELLQTYLTEVLMAQGFQDLTGQVIRRVIELVREVEDSLIGLLTMFGGTGDEAKPATAKKKSTDKAKAEGPIIDAESRDDVAASQDEVDDLLSSLGF